LKEVLERGRLFRLLDSGRRHAVVWVSGPPGSGKTTLLSSYVQSRKLPSLWYQMDGGDSDLATFFYYMGLAGTKTAPRKKRPLPLLTPEYHVPTFTRRFFEDLTGRLYVPSLIVLDNYQEVSAVSALHEALSHGFSSIPEGISVIVLSRLFPPKEFARLCASETIFFVEWEDLRLRENESKELAKLHARKSFSAKAFQDLHERTAGWAAGVVLLTQRGTGIMDEQRSATFEEVFDYFAGEILEGTDTKTREFLLKTALLPSMTPRSAEAMSGLKEANRILNAFFRNNYFTDRRPGLRYQYHPLFREFLLDKAEERFSRKELAGLQRQAAKVLEEEGHLEDAARLLIEAEDWQQLIRLILSQAPLLAVQGRFSLLERWLGNLPRELVNDAPWLIYWRGVCYLPYNQQQSRKNFEKAFNDFFVSGNAAGAFLSWSGVVDSIVYGFENFRRLDPWIYRFRSVIEKFVAFPSEAVEARVASSMFMALVHRKPEHPEFDKWAERALAQKGVDGVARTQALLVFLFDRVRTGDVSGSERVLDSVNELVQSSDLPPLAQLNAALAKVLYCNLVARYDECLETVKKSIELARTTGVHVMDFMILGNGIISALGEGDEAEAERLLVKIRTPIGGVRPWDLSFYYFLTAWLAFLQGRLNEAGRYVDAAMEMVEQIGDFFGVALSSLLRAHILHALGDDERAVDCVAKSRSIGHRRKSSMFEFMCLLARAEFAVERDREASMNFLRGAMTVGRKEGFVNTWILWRRQAMSMLCAKALESGIEVDYVRDLIRKRGLTPEVLPLQIEAWPWKLKVYTLGRFSAVCEGKPQALRNGKGGKPLEMLKLLVALGGRDVSEGRVADTLWPEAEGDAARRASTTTLYRLRRIVGEDAIVLKDGRLTLSPRHCWADSWAFERLVSEAESLGRETTAEGLETTETAFKLYKGSFLSNEPNASWATGVRERLRSKFVRIALKLGKYWERSDRFDRAVECYQKGVEVDYLVEEFYEHMMECYRSLGRMAEALATYRRCEEIFASQLEIEPSVRMKAMFREIKGNGRPSDKK
jgi:LuxR family maltose regulon positive regulatory protein